MNDHIKHNLVILEFLSRPAHIPSERQTLLVAIQQILWFTQLQSLTLTLSASTPLFCNSKFDNCWYIESNCESTNEYSNCSKSINVQDMTGKIYFHHHAHAHWHIDYQPNDSLWLILRTFDTFGQDTNNIVLCCVQTYLASFTFGGWLSRDLKEGFSWKIYCQKCSLVANLHFCSYFCFEITVSRI